MKNEKNADCIMNEALLINQPSHLNIIKVFDYYKIKNRSSSYVMEYSKYYALKEIVEDCERISD